MADLTFISDLHLVPRESAVENIFLALLTRLSDRARSGREQRLYVLGDLFAFWIERPPLMRRLHARALDALAAAVRAGCRVFVLDGNRDFGYGRAIAELSGAEPLGERATIQAGGRTALLLHGDQFLTADRRYRLFKRVVRSSPARLAARSLPGPLVLWTVARLEGFSRREKALKPAKALELDAAAAARMMLSAGAELLVCGHFHRPEDRPIDVAGRPGRLFVLGSWAPDGATILEWPEGAGPRLARWPGP